MAVKRRAVLVGVNVYDLGPANTLRGCVNDVYDIAAFLTQKRGFAAEDIKILTDMDAVKSAIVDALNAAVEGLLARDIFIHWNSSHGAQMIDGDSGTDCCVPHDFDWTPAHAMTGDDYHAIFSKIAQGVIAQWGSDSCHSGDLEKLLVRNPRYCMARFIPNPYGRVAAFRRGMVNADRVLPYVACASGCASSGTSADAFINNRYNGAFTRFWLNSQAAEDDPLRGLVVKTIAGLKAAGYDQVPELHGPDAATAMLFAAAAGIQEPQPVYDSNAQDPQCIPGQVDPQS